jgi:hypothetical protein
MNAMTDTVIDYALAQVEAFDRLRNEGKASMSDSEIADTVVDIIDGIFGLTDAQFDFFLKAIQGHLNDLFWESRRAA